MVTKRRQLQQAQLAPSANLAGLRTSTTPSITEPAPLAPFFLSKSARQLSAIPPEEKSQAKQLTPRRYLNNKVIHQ